MGIQLFGGKLLFLLQTALFNLRGWLIINQWKIRHKVTDF